MDKIEQVGNQTNSEKIKRSKRVVLVYNEVEYEINIQIWESFARTTPIGEIVERFGRARTSSGDADCKDEWTDDNIAYWIEEIPEEGIAGAPLESHLTACISTEQLFPVFYPLYQCPENVVNHMQRCSPGKY